MEKDYYKTLGIGRNASPDDIQKAYKKLARKYHPDLNPDDESAKENFQRVQEAYDVLNDSEKRELYDRYGSSFESMGSGPGGWSSTDSSGFQDIDFTQFFGQRGAGGGYGNGFDEIFRQFRDGGRSSRARSATSKGSDVEYEIEVPFQVAVTGGKQNLVISRPGGKQDTIEMTIPAGIESGKRLRLPSQGQPGSQGGPPGDLFVKVKVADHPVYRRSGLNLEFTLPVTIAEAALGTKVDVPTPRGTITLTVPANTSSGKRLRAKGRGIARKDGKTGDLFAEIQIALPSALDEDSQHLLQQFQERNPQAVRNELRW